MNTPTPPHASDNRQPDAPASETASSAPARDAPLTDSAPRRTWLAAERTYLAWLRTGLGALGLALAVGRLLPALIDVSHIEFGLLGIGYGLLGVVLLLIGAYRALRLRTALAADRPLPMDAWTVWLLTIAGIVLAVVTLVMLVAEI